MAEVIVANFPAAWAAVSAYMSASLAPIASLPMVAAIMSTLGATGGSTIAAATATAASTGAAAAVSTVAAGPVAVGVGVGATLIALTKYALDYGLKFYTINKIGNGAAILFVGDSMTFGVSTVGILAIAVIALVAIPFLARFGTNIWRPSRNA